MIMGGKSLSRFYRTRIWTTHDVEITVSAAVHHSTYIGQKLTYIQMRHESGTAVFILKCDRMLEARQRIVGIR